MPLVEIEPGEHRATLAYVLAALKAVLSPARTDEVVRAARDRATDSVFPHYYSPDIEERRVSGGIPGALIN